MPHIQIIVHTSKDQVDPYDGDVVVLMTGLYGTTDEEKLVGSTAVFAPGSAEAFTLKARDVGALAKVRQFLPCAPAL